MTQNQSPCSTWPRRRMAQRFDDLLSPRKRKRGSSKSATLLFSLDTPAAIILLHPVKVVPKVWYLVGIDLIEAPTTSQNNNRFLLSRRCKRPLYKLCDSLSCVKQRCGRGLKCHAYYEFKTANRSFIHVCLLIGLFSIFVFGCLESDDRSCQRLRHCSLVNSSLKLCKHETLYSEAMLCVCKFQLHHVLSQRLLPMGFLSAR